MEQNTTGAFINPACYLAGQGWLKTMADLAISYPHPEVRIESWIYCSSAGSDHDNFLVQNRKRHETGCKHNFQQLLLACNDRFWQIYTSLISGINSDQRAISAVHHSIFGDACLPNPANSWRYSIGSYIGAIAVVERPSTKCQLSLEHRHVPAPIIPHFLGYY